MSTVPLAESVPTNAQERFDATYITSTEIAERMRVSPQTVVHARRRGTLPDPIVVNRTQIYLWERTEVEPYLAAWNLAIQSRKGELRKEDA